MRIALACVPVKNKDLAGNIRAMTDAMAQTRGQADVVVFGESVLQGFDCLCWDYETDRHMAVNRDHESIWQMRQAARENHIAVSFGLIEEVGDALFSSQMFLGADGEIVNIFHRVSTGWKEIDRTDGHYREGQHFGKFFYGGRSFAVGLCGDLWTQGRPEEMKALGADVVLWPVWCDYSADAWNQGIQLEYAEQAARCGDRVLLVNPYCGDRDAPDAAQGGAVYFRNGGIVSQLPAGKPGTLIVEV